MNEKDFLENYLWPSEGRLNMTFTHPLPNIEGLKRCGDLIVQSEHEDTFQTSIITKYESDTLGVRLIEIYKNTQNNVTGVFYRLVGGINLVKPGYPMLRVGAGVSNVNMFTGEREDLATRVTIHLPQADPEQRKKVFQSVNDQAKEDGIALTDVAMSQLPAFYGSVLVTESKGVSLNIIRKLREYAWNSYKVLIEETKEKVPFDYKPLQEQMIFHGSKSEHLAFKKMGLSVPVEAQAAVFSVEVSGI
jgi:hypothetical protein